MKVIQSLLFLKQKKKLHKQDISDLDAAIRCIVKNPNVGDFKAGDLKLIRVFKFKVRKQNFLIAYETSKTTIFLYSFSSHENFYKNLKKYLKSNF